MSNDALNLTNERIADIEHHSHYWNADEGWCIWETFHAVAVVSVTFADKNGASLNELRLMRQWLPELSHLPAKVARKEIGDTTSYVAGEFGLMEGRQLAERGRDLGLNIVIQERQDKYEMPFCPPDRMMALLDDDAEREYIIRRMREAGCPVIMVEED